MWILSCSPGATEGGLDQHETQSVGPPTPTPQGFRLEAGRESLSWEPPGRPQGQESQVVVGGLSRMFAESTIHPIRISGDSVGLRKWCPHIRSGGLAPPVGAGHGGG